MTNFLNGFTPLTLAAVISGIAIASNLYFGSENVTFLPKIDS